jgi:hypothetical protein
MAYTAIDDPSVYFQTLLYTGNSSTRSVTNDGNADLQPDWVWTKCRSNASDNFVFDSNRGVHKRLFTNTTAAEVSNTNALTAFNSDGFSMGNVGGMNFNSQTYVAWQWKANGGTTSSNSDGDITSTVQANTTAGFSIVTYTGNGTDGHTVGHGLSGNWDLCILKNRDATDYWTFSRTGTNQVLLLHDNVNEANHSTAYMTKANGVIGLVGAGDLTMVNGNTEKYVAYVFKQIQGYSKFGSYTGNGNADGAFVYTGFKPSWLLGKRTDGTGNSWFMFDNKRNTENVMDAYLYANETSAETTGTGRVDFLSNGFKWRNTAAAWNGSGNTYVYMAFAEHPFVSSEGVPTTAR